MMFTTIHFGGYGYPYFWVDTHIEASINIMQPRAEALAIPEELQAAREDGPEVQQKNTKMASAPNPHNGFCFMLGFYVGCVFLWMEPIDMGNKFEFSLFCWILCINDMLPCLSGSSASGRRSCLCKWHAIRRGSWSRSWCDWWCWRIPSCKQT